MLKKILSVLICAVLLLASLAVFASATGTYVNGNKVRFYYSNGITMVSVRDFFDSYGGYKIGWSNSEKSATVSGNGLEMKIGLYKGYSDANGRMLARYIENSELNGGIYAPVTVLAKAVGAEVNWDGKTATVTVGKKTSAVSDGEKFYNTDDLYYMSRIIEAEAGIEPFFGKCAVGNVVLNRVKSTEFPNNIKDVIYDTKYGVQFTPVANGTINNTPREESIIAAKCVLDDFSISKEVLYFLNPQISKSLWIVNNRRFCFSIGTHDFYS